jgi:hypothetical protein
MSANRKGVAIERQAALGGEHEVVLPGEQLTPTDPRQRRGDIRGHGHHTDLPRFRRGQLACRVARPHTDGQGVEVDIAPAQPEQLASAQAGERGGEEDRAVDLGGGRAD